MATDKDYEQDLLIRQNAENIRRNEDAIRRQTEALEKIRDHYFPKKTLWKKSLAFFLKVVGAVTVGAGLMETGDWYWNTRKTDAMAAQSATVAKRLFLKENDIAGAVRFLEKAVELDGGSVRYRIPLTYVKGMSAIGDLFDLGRPLTRDERTRVDEILAEAVFLQETAPDEPMPHVLAAQAYGLRGEKALASQAADRAVELAPENVQARITACAMRVASGDLPSARRQLAEAARIEPTFPLVTFWQAVFAFEIDRDVPTARARIDELLARAPRFARAHVYRGRILMAGAAPDRVGARAAFAQALSAKPDLAEAMTLTAETYEGEGNLALARLWLDRALATDAKDMSALKARARVRGRTGDPAGAVADLTAAIELAPFRADLYRARAKAYAADGKTADTAADDERAAALEKTSSK